MIKIRKLFCLFISMCLLFSVMTTSFIASANESLISSNPIKGDSSLPYYAVPPEDTTPSYIIPSPDPLPWTTPTDWVQPTIPPYSVVIPLDMNAEENVLQIDDIGFVSFPDNSASGDAWHFNISDMSIVQLDSSITVPYSNPDVILNSMMPANQKITSWYFKALRQGTTSITFYQDNVYTLDSSSVKPGFRAICFNIRVGDPLPPTPTPTPWIEPTWPPIPGDGYLQPYQQNVLKIGATGTVMLDENLTTGYLWSYRIEDSSVMSLGSDNYVPYLNSDPAIGSGGTHFWYFNALKEGETKIIFTCSRNFEAVPYDEIGSYDNTLSKELIFGVLVNSSGEVTVRPTIPPRPTPQNFVALDSDITNVLYVGSVGVVKLDPNSIFAWSYEIGDSTIIDNLQMIIMADGQVNSGDPSISIYPYKGPWLFTALKEGETTITFTSNPINGDMKIRSEIIEYKIQVTSSGEVTVSPTEDPVVTPYPTPQDYITLDSAITNVLNVGSIASVKQEPNFAVIWSYEIADKSIIDCLQAFPMNNGELDIYMIPYNGPWLFTALKDGETTITFTGNPISDAMGMPSQMIEYRIQVDSSGVVTASPTEDPTVTSDPNETPIPEPTPWDGPIFTVPDNFEWAQEAVTNLSREGIINGYEDGTYKPENYVTRAEFAKMLVVTFGIYYQDAISVFSDVPTGEWYNSYIASAEAAGLVRGNGDGSFSPNATITREEMFIFCARAIEKFKGYQILEKTSPEIAPQVNAFVDGSTVSDWALDCVATVTKCGLVNGSPVEGGNAINPQEPITRAEVAVVLNRVLFLS